jgi:uncharacterized protein YhbP (UPF0306 family)
MTQADQDFIRELVMRNRYLTLATTDGGNPWIAPLEYITDDDLNLYFFSPRGTAHSQYIELGRPVAVAIFDPVQPDFEPAPSFQSAGVQLRATAAKLEQPYSDPINAQIAAWQLQMPPYAVYRIMPERWFMPIIRDGVNERVEVAMD